MSNKVKKAIRDRMARTGESYSTARMHLLQQGYGRGGSTGAEPASRVRQLVEEILRLAPAPATRDDTSDSHEPLPVARVRDVPADPEADLRRDPLYQHLRQLDDEDLRKVEVLAHAGRERGVDVLELAAELGRDMPRATAEHLVEKARVLGEYLRSGLGAADEQGVDLDAAWPELPMGTRGMYVIRGFEAVHERGPLHPAAVVTGAVVDDAFEFRLDGVMIGRLATPESGRDRKGPWAAVEIGDAELDTGVSARVRPGVDEVRRRVDGVEIDLQIVAPTGDESDDDVRPGDGKLAVWFDLDGRWCGGGLPARRLHPDELARWLAT